MPYNNFRGMGKQKHNVHFFIIIFIHLQRKNLTWGFIFGSFDFFLKLVLEFGTEFFRKMKKIKNQKKRQNLNSIKKTEA